MTTRKSSFQNRGVERRHALILACRELLKTHHVGSFGLAEVAAHAGIPKTSVYHFFPGIDDLLGAAAIDVAQDLLAHVDRPLAGPFAAWPAVVAAFIALGRAFYAENPDALEIQLGPFTPSHIKNHDRDNDLSIARVLLREVRRHFAVPDSEGLEATFFRAIEIADLMFMLSVRGEGDLTAFYVDEAARAASAYLGLYLPALLPRTAPDPA